MIYKYNQNGCHGNDTMLFNVCPPFSIKRMCRDITVNEFVLKRYSSARTVDPPGRR